MRDPRKVEVLPISHPKGCHSYVIVDPVSREACVVDPLLDRVKEILDAVSSRKASVRWVVDTHSHGDHISGAAALKSRLACDVVMHPDAQSDVATLRPQNGEVLPFGEGGLRVHHAPGISPDALVLEAPGAVFTGDTLLIGTVGLRDVPGADARAHYDTLHRVFSGLAEATVIHPGHDDMGRHLSTLKAERRGNRWLREDDFEAFHQRWDTDPRKVAKEAGEFLEANRVGLLRVPKDFAPALGMLDAAHATEARVQGEERVESAAEAAGTPRPAVQSGLSAFMAVCGAGTLIGWLGGTFLVPALHTLSLGCGLAMLLVGLFGGENRRRKSPGTPGGGLYYQGPSRNKMTS